MGCPDAGLVQSVSRAERRRSFESARAAWVCLRLFGAERRGQIDQHEDVLGAGASHERHVELLGRKLDEESRIELLRETGSLIESPSGYLHLTARENLAIVCDLKGVSHREIDRVLDIVRLTGDANRRVGQYSLGMKQRLGIATALLGRPRLLILDEPTNGLDPAGIQEMRSLIASMPEATARRCSFRAICSRNGADGDAGRHHSSRQNAL